MTRSRQKLNAPRAAAPRLALAGVAAMAAGLAAFGPLAGPWPAAQAGTTQRVVTDYYTGLAIDGFDPVSYFVGGAPQRGRAEWEMRFEGASWRFANQGNRVQFSAAPQVYAPRFGGYDAVELADGKAVPGQPLIWTIHDERLYLFASEANRLAFSGRPGTLADKAGRAWPQIRATLAR